MNFIKNLKPVHLALGIICLLFMLLVVSLIIKTIKVSDFIIKTENKTFDIRQTLLVNNKAKKPNKDIVIVTVDDASYEYLTTKYGEWPLPRNIYADLIHFMEKQSPNAIAFDLMFVSSLKSGVDADNKLATAMSTYDNVYTGMNFDNMSYGK